MKKLKTVEELSNIIENSENLVIFKFGGEWCGPCKMLEHTISEIEGTLENVQFYEIDVDEADEELIEKYQIQSIPVLLFFNEGLQVDRITGARGKSELLELIEKNK